MLIITHIMQEEERRERGEWRNGQKRKGKGKETREREAEGEREEMESSYVENKEVGEKSAISENMQRSPAMQEERDRLPKKVDP